MLVLLYRRESETTACLFVLISTWTAFQVAGLYSLLGFVLSLKRCCAFQEAYDNYMGSGTWEREINED